MSSCRTGAPCASVAPRAASIRSLGRSWATASSIPRASRASSSRPPFSNDGESSRCRPEIAGGRLIDIMPLIRHSTEAQRDALWPPRGRSLGFDRRLKRGHTRSKLLRAPAVGKLFQNLLVGLQSRGALAAELLYAGHV